MKRKNKLGLFYRLLFAAAACAALAGMVIYAKQCRETAGRAAQMCIETILPSLFPFMVLSDFCIGMGYVRALGRRLARPMRRLFNLGGVCAGPFLLGIIGGYPIGAKSAIALYETGQCSRAECERMLSFCNNSGPAFMLGVVGSGVFASSAAGIALYAAHVLASISVGIIFRFYKKSEPALPRRRAPEVYEQPRFARVFTSSVTQALRSVAGISAFVIFFAVATDMLFSCGALPAVVRLASALLSPLGATRSSIERLIVGLMELTSGLGGLSGAAGSMNAKLCMAAFLLGWAGISVHCQVLSFISSGGLSLKPYFLGKLLHGILSALYIRIFLSAYQPDGISAASAQLQVLGHSGSGAAAVQALCVCAATVFAMLFPYIRNFFQRHI